ncbi:MAG: hypothetical protein EOP51_26415 [Sphingobacteriales bacterium]|nr:MAG: hypothetical protein EOP51_26415 [Sphingobacteriales bacterium]
MNPVVKNILAVIAGFIVGSIVNMGILMMSSSVIPPPAGVDVTTMEGLKAAMPLFEPKHFLFPFLAHAIGTLAGAYTASKLAANHKMKFALVIGVLFLIGGIANVVMLPSPIWYSVIDITLAYLPMAYLGGRLGNTTQE